MSDKWRPVCEARQFLLNEAVYRRNNTYNRDVGVIRVLLLGQVIYTFLGVK